MPNLYPNPFVVLISDVINLYNMMLFAYMVLSWLISFGIVNRNQQAVQKVNYALFRLTDPLLRPIRKYMPDLGGIDISPVPLLLIMNFVQNSLRYYM